MDNVRKIMEMGWDFEVDPERVAYFTSVIQSQREKSDWSVFIETIVTDAMTDPDGFTGMELEPPGGSDVE